MLIRVMLSKALLDPPTLINGGGEGLSEALPDPPTLIDGGGEEFYAFSVMLHLLFQW